MGAKDQRGNPSPIWEEVKEEEDEGGPLSLASGGAGALPGAIIITAIFTNISITFPLLYPAVHSPASLCTLYLNMVLYASYYFAMMCCHPMMSEKIFVVLSVIDELL